MQRLRRAAHRKAVDAYRRHTYADRYALAFLATSADSGIEFHVVADHADPCHGVRAVADYCGSFTGVVTLPFFIRYASDAEKTNFPLVMSTWPPPKFTA